MPWHDAVSIMKSRLLVTEENPVGWLTGETVKEGQLLSPLVRSKLTDPFFKRFNSSVVLTWYRHIKRSVWYHTTVPEPSPLKYLHLLHVLGEKRTFSVQCGSAMQGTGQGSGSFLFHASWLKNCVDN